MSTSENMTILARIRSWWKALAHRSQMESELESELSFHVESYAEDLVRQGVPLKEALRRAKIELGPAAAQKEEVRSSVGLRVWDDLRADVRYALRQLRRTPAFTATVLLVLALGIGANAAMFSVIDATLLRWLPYSRPGQLVQLTTVDEQGAPSWMFYPDLVEWRSQAKTFESLAYYTDVEAFLETESGQQQVSRRESERQSFSSTGRPAKTGAGISAGRRNRGQRVRGGTERCGLAKHVPGGSQRGGQTGQAQRQTLYGSRRGATAFYVSGQ